MSDSHCGETTSNEEISITADFMEEDMLLLKDQPRKALFQTMKKKTASVTNPGNMSDFILKFPLLSKYNIPYVWEECGGCIN